MLSLRAVNQFYGNQHTLWNITLELQPGKCTSVIGLPGMGKTTLIHCITGFLPIESGSIFWHGDDAPPCDLLPLSAPHRTALGMGYVPQERRIFSQLTVEENLHIAHAASGDGAVKRGIYDFFPELCALRQRKAATLSHEQQYQLALASALVAGPRLLILDEPTRGAGQAFLHKLGEIILRLKRELGLTILLAEQHLSFIHHVSDRFLLLHQGRNVAQGQVNQLDQQLLTQWMTPAPGR
ncbi:ABC transporter ATP-binding protein [Superficieibacter electus]|uniref:ABC transporter ATP-binding protein n=1 Tax=Superficieibacter electus TaxID=2022662 RepID=A0A2P5GS07_9ENTR|nr:ATP-binding cassette domain-containing protein [Superficieibacter electus]POP46017.1 ABC transporter ATP-binding protein [Superficieibacter electus]POP49324.1 ABC transporter ATP-binding protein [Superficieibacter electus]